MKDNNSLIFFCDMDGVLANFNEVPFAVQRFVTEKDFFKRLKPIEANVKGLLAMIDGGFDVRILSTSPHKRADKDKLAWLRSQGIKIPKNKIIFSRPVTISDKEKIDYIKNEIRERAVLIDDYGVNIRAWEKGGGLTAVKITPEPKDELEFLEIGDFMKVLQEIL